MENYIQLIHAIHVVAGSCWVGEVLVINVVLIPVLSHYQGNMRKQFLVTIFPKIFRLASILSATVVITGMLLVYHMTNGRLDSLLSGRWGLSILFGGGLGTVLTLFHFFMENRLAKKIGLGKMGDDRSLGEVHMKLKVVPRLGLVVITTILLLMINAAHGVL